MRLLFIQKINSCIALFFVSLYVTLKSMILTTNYISDTNTWFDACYQVLKAMKSRESLQEFTEAIGRHIAIYHVFFAVKNESSENFILKAVSVSEGHSIPSAMQDAIAGVVKNKKFDNQAGDLEISEVIPENYKDCKRCSFFYVRENYNYHEYLLIALADFSDYPELKVALRSLLPVYLLNFKPKDTAELQEYRLLVEHQSDMVVKVDAEGRFLYVNPAYCKMFGKKEEELLGNKFFPLVHPDDLETTRNEMQKLNVAPYTCYLEQRALTSDGWKWLSWSDTAITNSEGGIEYIIGVGRDISQIKQGEQNLEESERKFRIAFLQSPNLMSITRATDGRIYDINDRFVEFLGKNREDVIGKTTSSLGLFDHFSRKQLLENLKKNGFVRDLEFEISFPEGKHFTGLFSAEVIKLNHENYLVSSVSDITELKSARLQLEAYRNHLEGLVEERTASLIEKNQELDHFTFSVSHDLKAPLRAIKSYSRALNSDYQQLLDEEGKNYLSRLIAVADQMEKLINDLLEFSKLSRSDLKLVPTSTYECLAEAMELVNHDLERSGGKIMLQQQYPLVMASKPALVRVFENLFSNAIKFCQKGQPPVIEVSAFTENGKVKISVADNGIGISADKLKVIFKVFERLHGIESYPGSGIGLTIAAKSVEKMQGSIYVASEPEKGSIFTVVLNPVIDK